MEIVAPKRKILKLNRNGELEISCCRTKDHLFISLRQCCRYFQRYGEKEDDDEQIMNLFRNKIGPAVLHSFIRNIPNEEEDEIVVGTMVIIPHAHAWMCICVKLLIMKDYRGWSESI